jgi:hypothetical protein
MTIPEARPPASGISKLFLKRFRKYMTCRLPFQASPLFACFLCTGLNENQTNTGRAIRIDDQGHSKPIRWAKIIWGVIEKAFARGGFDSAAPEFL